MNDELKYEELFDDNAVIGIDREEFNYIMSGYNRFLNIIQINDLDDIENTIYNSLKTMNYEYFYNDNAIIYIKYKDNITLFTQSKIIDAIRKVFDSELSVIFGSVKKEDIDSEILVYLLSSKIDESVA